MVKIEQQKLSRSENHTCAVVDRKDIIYEAITTKPGINEIPAKIYDQSRLK